MYNIILIFIYSITGQDEPNSSIVQNKESQEKESESLHSLPKNIACQSYVNPNPTEFAHIQNDEMLSHPYQSDGNHLAQNRKHFKKKRGTNLAQSPKTKKNRKRKNRKRENRKKEKRERENREREYDENLKCGETCSFASCQISELKERISELESLLLEDKQCRCAKKYNGNQMCEQKRTYSRKNNRYMSPGLINKCPEDIYNFNIESKPEFKANVQSFPISQKGPSLDNFFYGYTPYTPPYAMNQFYYNPPLAYSEMVRNQEYLSEPYMPSNNYDYNRNDEENKFVKNNNIIVFR